MSRDLLPLTLNDNFVPLMGSTVRLQFVLSIHEYPPKCRARYQATDYLSALIGSMEMGAILISPDLGITAT